MHRRVAIQNLINYLLAIIKECNKIEKEYPGIEYTYHLVTLFYNSARIYYKATGFYKWHNNRITLDDTILDENKDVVVYDIHKNTFMLLKGEDIYKAEFIDDNSFDSFISIISKKPKLVLTNDYISSKLNFILDKERYISIDNLIEKASQISNQIRTQNKDNKKHFIILNVADTFTYLYNDPYYYYPIIRFGFVFNIEKYYNSSLYSSYTIYNLVKDFKNNIISLAIKQNIVNNSFIFNTEIVDNDFYKNISVLVSFDFYDFLDILLLADLCESSR